ncbi:MAG TPA: peptide MFS transporter, partial [Polyangiaceae bacterium]|nr:peptide MFS transporter [Polyangiaceae bacterium]
MWERFSYYGMRALLVLYLVKQLGWQPSDSSATYKWYTSLVYLTPLLGGLLADRFLGLRASIITGGVLMAIGHFLMAFPSLPFLYAALAFLIAGNGFFKPNISTLVGRMYSQDDPRRNGAFTIFYMGINIGAALSAVVCGQLREHFGFHYGFAAAGIGMVLGLVIFLLGQKQVAADVEAVGNTMGVAAKKAAESNEEPDLAELREGHRGIAGLISKAIPLLMIGIGAIVPVLSISNFVWGKARITDVLMPTAFGIVALVMGILLRTIRGVARDKSVVIFVLFAFVVLFWMAFEQAGNALNLWADYHTDLHLGSFAYPAEYWQSVNPVFIFALAPLFSVLWLWLARRNLEPSTPAKMLIAMILMAASFGAMVAAAQSENQTVSRVALEALPEGALLEKVDAGRLRYDASTHELEVRGVLAPFVVTEALEAVAAPSYRVELDKLTAPDAESKNRLLRTKAPAAYAAALDKLAAESNRARTSGIWLFFSYLFATIGELCLSPVGLSMVTKLAPQRFASLFMGVWLLASSVAQYVGGSLGENWGKVTPTSYFFTFVWTSCVGAVALVLLVAPLKRLMHNAVR